MPESESSGKNIFFAPDNPGKSSQKWRKIVPQNFRKNANFEVRFSGIIIMISQAFSGEKNPFCVNFPIPASSVPQKPEKVRKFGKKVEKCRKGSEKVGKLGALNRFVGAVLGIFQRRLQGSSRAQSIFLHKVSDAVLKSHEEIFKVLKF